MSALTPDISKCIEHVDNYLIEPDSTQESSLESMVQRRYQYHHLVTRYVVFFAGQMANSRDNWHLYLCCRVILEALFRRLMVPEKEHSNSKD